MSSSADRIQAARILIRIEGGAFASRILASLAGAGVRARVLGVLRWVRALDEALEAHCSRSLEALDAEVRTALRLGLAETVVLGVPAAVATDGAVHLARRLAHGSASGLVNAVLRRAIADWSERMSIADADTRLSHPAWLFRRWVDRYGAEAAESMMTVNQQPAPVWAWFFDDSARQDLVGHGVVLDPHPWCSGSWCAPSDAARLLAVVRSGRAYVQDPSSQAVAKVSRRLAAGGGRFADLCAAPGGKTALIASGGGWSSGVACDRRIGRVRLMEPVLSRFECCSVVVADSTTPPLPSGGFDLVLLDAPCTGTGTLRRHPELKWRLRLESIAELVPIQKELLAGAADLVAPGGVLVYSTCSIEPEENEDQFPVPPDGLGTVDLEPELPEGLPAVPTTAGGVTILPHEFGDGFTIHAFRRVRRWPRPPINAKAQRHT